MNRIIKFRAWDERDRFMYVPEGITNPFNGVGRFIYMQFTGLLDKNGDSRQEVYEGDIIDSNGKIKGNIYEMDKGETDLVIEGFGTSAWSKTEMAGLARGLEYAE